MIATINIIYQNFTHSRDYIYNNTLFKSKSLNFYRSTCNNFVVIFHISKGKLLPKQYFADAKCKFERDSESDAITTQPQLWCSQREAMHSDIRPFVVKIFAELISMGIHKTVIFETEHTHHLNEFRLEYIVIPKLYRCYAIAA